MHAISFPNPKFLIDFQFIFWDGKSLTADRPLGGVVAADGGEAVAPAELVARQHGGVRRVLEIFKKSGLLIREIVGDFLIFFFAMVYTFEAPGTMTQSKPLVPMPLLA